MITYIRAHWVRFLKYTGSGLIAFSLDLGLLYLATGAALPYVLAVPLSFLTATSLHYLAARALVFADTTRTTGRGYINFIAIMGTNAVLITILVSILVTYAALPLFPARIVVGVCIGLVSFFINSRYNFKIK